MFKLRAQIFPGSFLILFIMFFSCHQETEKTDLNSEVFSVQDSLKLNSLIDSLKQYYPQSSDSISVFSEYICSQFSHKLNKVYSSLAMAHFSKSNYSFVEFYFRKNANLFLSDSLFIDYAENLGNIGVVKEVSGDYTSAIDYYLQALEIFNKHHLRLKSSMVYNNIGIVYQQLNEPENALHYYFKALEISESLEREDLNAKRYNNIASIYEEFLNSNDSAMHYYNKAHAYYVKSNSPYLPVIENNMAYLYVEAEAFEKADSLFKKALKYYDEHNQNSQIAPVLRNQAQLFFKQKKYALAINKLDEALSLSKDNHNKELEIEILQVYIEIYEQTQQYAEANAALKQLFILQEEVKGIEHMATIERLQVQFQVKEKVQKIEILELKNHVQNKKLWQLWFLITTLFVVLLAFVIIHRLQKKNSRLQLLQMQRDISDYLSQIEEIKEQTQKDQQKTQDEMLKQLKGFGLTDREEEVLVLISQGYKNAEIAEKMFVSLNTIKTHTKNIFIKLDVKNRTQAAKKAQIVH